MFKRIIGYTTLIFFLFFSSGFNQIYCQAINKSAETKERVSLAVLNFKNDSPNKNWEYMEKAIAEILSTQLAKQKRLRVVERSQLDKALQEMKLGQSGVIDTNTAQQLGKVLGASVIVIGSITQLGRMISISSRLIDVATGEAITGISVKCESEEELGNIVEELAEKAVQALLQPGEIETTKETVSQPAITKTEPSVRPTPYSTLRPKSDISMLGWIGLGIGAGCALLSLAASGNQNKLQDQYNKATDPDTAEKLHKDLQEAYGASLLWGIFSAVGIVSGGIILIMSTGTGGTSSISIPFNKYTSLDFKIMNDDVSLSSKLNVSYKF